MYNFSNSDLGKGESERLPQKYSFVSFRDETKEFLEEFNSKAKEKYGKASRNITVLTKHGKNNTLRGSNPFAVVHADNILKEQGIRVATSKDIEEIFLDNSSYLRHTFEDIGILLRNNFIHLYDSDSSKLDSAALLSNPNQQIPYLARNIFDQFETRNIRKGKTPQLIHLRGLELVNDNKSDYGLSFKLTDESEFMDADSLIAENNRKTFSGFDDNGIPILGAGKRRVFTSEVDLSRAYIGWDKEFVACKDDLANSCECARIVLVRQK